MRIFQRAQNAVSRLRAFARNIRGPTPRSEGQPVDYESRVTERSDVIGFLPIGREFVFKGGAFTPLEKFDQSLKAVEDRTNVDHFIYPPTTRKQTSTKLVDFENSRLLSDDEIEWQDVPGTERPALLHHLPPSHILTLNDAPHSGTLREADGAFMMHLLGYLFGFRLQFYDWRFDGRVQLTSAHHAVPRRESESAFLSTGYAAWKEWPVPTQKRMTNALFMLSRAPTYEWDWERFSMYYMVFDALYRIANEAHGVVSKTHKERLPAMCAHFGLYQDSAKFEMIVELRNDLFHESLWSGSQPCHGFSEEHFRQVDNLRRINERLVPAILGFDTGYIANHWDHIGMASF